MAETAIIRMRLHTWEAHGSIVGSDINVPNQVAAGEPKILELYMEHSPADAAGFSEIDPVTGHNLEDPAVAVELLSSNNEDNSSGTGAVATVYTIGIDENDEIVQRIETMHAVTGTTVVTTTNLYKELFHMFSASWGSADKDATGNITVQDIADNDICIIAATKNESDGSAFKVPDGHCAMLIHGHIKRTAAAAGVYAADEGVRLRILYINPLDGTTGVAAADRTLNWLTLEAVGAYVHEAVFQVGEVFEEGTWIHFQHSSKIDAGELVATHLKFLIWKK